MKKAVIFDLDGTLWNSVKQIIIAWNTVFSRYHEIGNVTVTEEKMGSFMGKTLEQIAKSLFPDCDIKTSLAILNEATEEEYDYLKNHGASLYPAVKETLLELQKDYSLYIVSNCEDGYIQTFLQCNGFESLFEDFECHGVTDKSKGENIGLIISRNNIDKAVYVGDTMSDFEACLYANVPFIHASYGFGKVECAEFSAKSFTDLPKLIKKLI